MILLLLMLLIMSNAIANNKEKSILYSRMIIICISLTTLITYNNIFLDVLDNNIGLYGGLFTINTFTQSFTILILILVAIISTLTSFYPRRLSIYTKKISIKWYPVNNNDTINNKFILNNKSQQFNIIEYGLITIFILSGALFLISTNDLISIFLSIELQSYGLYILCALYRNSESSTGSALTYFLLGGLSSCFILLGSALLYINSGTTNLEGLYVINSINELTDPSSYLYLPYYFNFSLIILVVGFLFKVSAAPFHFWSPDVYDGIPTITTTFVAIVAKISIFAFLLSLVLQVGNSEYTSYIDTGLVNSLSVTNEVFIYMSWKNIFLFSSLMSLIIGSLLGLTQHRIKRLFAYSTISHVGFILLALSVTKVESIQGYIFYIIQYSLSNLNAFFILIVIGYNLYAYIVKNFEETTNKNSDFKLIDVKNSPIQFISQLKGFFYINPILSISLSITLFSFVGVPPLIGFFAKQMVLSAALDEGYVFMSLVGIITSVIGAVYYLNLIKLIFFSKSNYVKSSLIDDNAFSLTQRFYSKTNLDVKEEQFLDSTAPNTSVNSALTTTITVLTMLILLFMCVPGEWFKIVNIISISLFKI